MAAVLNAVESARTFNWKDSLAQMPELEISLDPKKIYSASQDLAFESIDNFANSAKTLLAEYYPELDSKLFDSLDINASDIVISQAELDELQEFTNLIQGSSLAESAILTNVDMSDENNIARQPLMILGIAVFVVFYAAVAVKVKIY